jgi:hypothetical protein
MLCQDVSPVFSMIRLLLFVLLAAQMSSAQARGCNGSGADWNKYAHNLTADCPAKLTAPDGKKTLRVNSDGRFQLSFTRNGPSRAIGYSVEPPAMASWAPNSEAFFINDGEGSGMSSVFRLFRIKDGRAVRDDSIERIAVKRFRKVIGCATAATDPNVWGFGWSADGKQVFLLVQATVNGPCGKQGGFITLIVNLANVSVVEEPSEKQTEQRFRTLLFPELFSH